MLSTAKVNAKQRNAMDLSTKEKNDLNQEKKFYCPTEGCVFSKGYGKSFKKKMLVDQHFLNCHSERKFKCANCNKSYAIEWQLTYHSKTCGIDWTCLSCNKCYKERLSLITHCKRHNHILPENAKMKKQKKSTTDSNTVQTPPTVTTQINNTNNHHSLTINSLTGLNLNNLNGLTLNHVPQLTLQPRTDSIIDHSVDGTNYLNSNFLLGLSNRSLLNLNAAANNFNVKL